LAQRESLRRAPPQLFADFRISHFAPRSSEHVVPRSYFLERFTIRMFRLTLQDLTGGIDEVAAPEEAPDATCTNTPPTLREVYCLVHSCAVDEFNDHLFWRSLYPHAVPFAVSLYLVNPTYFRPERELIAALGSASSQQQLDCELRHFNNRRVLGWWRGRAHIRISTERLARIAVSYLNLASGNRAGGPMAA
jgi:hypothetical protein